MPARATGRRQAAWGDLLSPGMAGRPGDVVRAAARRNL